MSYNSSGYNVNGVNLIQSGTSWTVFTSGRVANSTYQNTSTQRIMLVSIDVKLPAGYTVEVKCSASSPPSTSVGSYTFGADATFPLVFFVPPNFYYRVDGTNYTYVRWVEYII